LARQIGEITMNVKQAYKLGRGDFARGYQSDDNPYVEDALADAWDRGFWAAEAGHVPSAASERVLDLRYGGGSAWSVG
jgi:hypothetical protein